MVYAEGRAGDYHAVEIAERDALRKPLAVGDVEREELEIVLMQQQRAFEHGGVG